MRLFFHLCCEGFVFGGCWERAVDWFRFDVVGIVIRVVVEVVEVVEDLGCRMCLVSC